MAVPAREDCQDGGVQHELGAEIRRLRGGRTQGWLARQVGVEQKRISDAERGVRYRLLPPEVIALVDEALDAGGALVALDAQARQEGPARGTITRDREEVDDMAEASRRQAMGWSGAMALTGVMAGPPAAVAAAISRSIDAANPAPLTLREIEADLRGLAVMYETVPPAQLLPLVEERWLGVERLLVGAASGRARTRLVTCAGGYAFYASQLGFQLGNERTADAYMSVAEPRAAESGNPLLLGSVAALCSSFQFFRGDDAGSMETAAMALSGDVHPFVRPKLASCEARAAARAGQIDRARRALTTMQESIWTGEVMPGSQMIDRGRAEGYASLIGWLTGDGEQAEIHARNSLALTPATDSVDLAMSHNDLARSLVNRAHPEPEEAARIAGKAFTLMQGRHMRTISGTTVALHRDMAAHWPELGAVLDLGELVRAAAPALPPGSGI